MLSDWRRSSIHGCQSWFVTPCRSSLLGVGSFVQRARTVHGDTSGTIRASCLCAALVSKAVLLACHYYFPASGMWESLRGRRSTHLIRPGASTNTNCGSPAYEVLYLQLPVKKLVRSESESQAQAPRPGHQATKLPKPVLPPARGLPKASLSSYLKARHMHC